MLRMDPSDLTDGIKMYLCLWSKVSILKMHLTLPSRYVKGMSLWKGGICEAGGTHPTGMHYFFAFLSEFHFDSTFIIIYEATLWSFNQAKVKAIDPS